MLKDKFVFFIKENNAKNLNFIFCIIQKFFILIKKLIY